MEIIPTSNPGVFNAGLVKVINEQGLETAELERQATLEAGQQEPTVVSELSTHLKKLWVRARDAKRDIEDQMLKSIRQRYGIYDPDKIAAIREMGGSEVYMLITLTKCRAAEAWVNDVLRPTSDRNFVIRPTPVAELTPDKEAEIEQDVFAVRDMVIQQFMSLGIPINWSMLEEEIVAYQEELASKVRTEIQNEARKRAERMAKRIEDELVEGGWHNAFWAAVQDLITLKVGVIKGPVLRRKKVQTWVQDENGTWAIDMREKVISTYERVSPFDIYPAPDSTGQDDGYLFQRHRLTRGDLVSMIGVPGYSEDAIRQVLDDYDNGKMNHLPIDTELNVIHKGNTDGVTYTDKIEALEFWGSILGKHLIEWGVDGVDPQMEYEVNAWTVGDYTIRLIINPDKLGRKPYNVDSFERVPGSFWGRGVPELMEDVQNVCNAIARAIVNNCGLASGPLVEVDQGRCEDVEMIYPWKIFRSSNKQMADGPAVRFYQPQIIVQPLLSAYSAFMMLADDQTGIPRWSHGNTQLLSGAGGTSSGLSMLMTSASRGIKEIISHIDAMVEGAIQKHYDMLMIYDEDDSIKGDAKVVARGSSALLAKEQRLVRTMEILQSTLNPIDLQIIGVEGRTKLLRSAFDLLEINESGEILPEDEEKLRELIKAVTAQAQQMAASMGAGGGEEKPMDRARENSGVKGVSGQPAPTRTLDASGAPMGGMEANFFQNRARPAQAAGPGQSLPQPMR